jgi:hypothetical protein
LVGIVLFISLFSLRKPKHEELDVDLTPANGESKQPLCQNEIFMHQVDQWQKAERRPITDHYVDLEGNEQVRASSIDFETLPSRHIQVILNLPGFKEDEDLVGWMKHASTHYDRGNYEEALQYLTCLLKRMPELEPYIFYYIRVCKRVVSVRTAKKKVRSQLRCKWCGRHTTYIHPDEPTFGFASSANSCMFCGRMYPMPTWMWDSPDGRAYSYYRMSFSDNEFYEEFEQDYDPHPLWQHPRK